MKRAANSIHIVIEKNSFFYIFLNNIDNNKVNDVSVCLHMKSSKIFEITYASFLFKRHEIALFGFT